MAEALNSSDRRLLRISTYNASLNRNAAGELISNLSTPDDEQAKSIAEIIQRNDPDVLLVNEFDYDSAGEAAALFQQNYLSVSHNGVDPVEYPYVYIAPSNTGMASGFDLDNNGEIVTTPGSPGYGDDAFGFGDFPGQFGMLLLSKYPIDTQNLRTFQQFLWKDMPGALLPDDPATPEPQDWYSKEELDVFRLSSKSHWDIPIEVDGEIIHALVSHPTPPVFDGPEDSNGKRNHDEIRFWADYITPGAGDYIYDDNGVFGGLSEGEKFVIMGDQNADPLDGDSVPGAIDQLLTNSLVNTSVTPSSDGGAEAAARQGGTNINHLGDPSVDTGDFGDEPPSSSGNLRTDYVLPSNNLSIIDSVVFWPASDDPLFRLVGEGGEVSSDHRLVGNDLVPTTVRDITLIGQSTFPPRFEFSSTEVGGLSSITYDDSAGKYYAISDDPSVKNDARFYTLTIDLSDGSLEEGDISFQDVTTLFDATGQPYTPESLDPEGLAYIPQNDTLFFSSEGFAQPTKAVNPFIKEISLAGEELQVVEVARKFNPVFEGEELVSGVENNAGFESLTVTPERRTFFTAAEDTLAQDGERASLESSGAARIVKYDLGSLQPTQEFIFEVAPIVEPPNPADEFKLQGLVELLALDEDTLLALERSFSVGGENGQGTGFTGLLYEVQLSGATDVSALDSIEGESITPVKKTLLLNTEDLGIEIDNIEGMTLGPVLPNGNQSLVMVADNDFDPTRPTQFLTFELNLNKMNTTQPETFDPMLVPVDETEYTTSALFTVGERLPGDYTPPGILDGIGAYALDDDTVRVLTNHELNDELGYTYEVSDGQDGTFSLTGARVSYLDINKESWEIEDSGLAYNLIYDANGEVATDNSFLSNIDTDGDGVDDIGNGLARFCSSVLIEAGQFGEGRGLEDTIYFTGEEDGGDFNPVGGAEWALDVETGELWQVPAMGRGAWENVTEIDTGTTTHVAFILADDSAPFDADGDGENEAAPLYLYVGEKNAEGDFLERNGLRDGQLYVWVSGTGETLPSEFNTSGTLEGHWVEVDNTPQPDNASEDGSTGFDEYGYPTQSNLFTQAEHLGAFGFSRPEDVAVNPEDGTEIVLASTGVDDYDLDPESGNGSDTFGTVYTVKTDLSDLENPAGDVSILYDGDADPTRALRSPDNLDWADDSFIYVQEDEAEETSLTGEPLFGEGAVNPNEAGIVKLDPLTGEATRIANIDRSVVIDPSAEEPSAAVDLDAGNAGEWESSGILDVSELFGKEGGQLFLANVQAHGIEAQNNFGSLINELQLVEGGQMVFLEKLDPAGDLSA